jgi:hypothetical protein
MFDIFNLENTMHRVNSSISGAEKTREELYQQTRRATQAF